MSGDDDHILLEEIEVIVALNEKNQENLLAEFSAIFQLILKLLSFLFYDCGCSCCGCGDGGSGVRGGERGERKKGRK